MECGQQGQGHYGTAGRAWLEWLADHMTEVEVRAATIMKRFETECVPEYSHMQVRRVAARFALVAAAGELATKGGLTGWEVGEAVQGVRRCFEGWLEKRGHSGNGERHAMLAQVKGFLETNADALFTWMHRGPDDHRASTPLRVGFKRMVDENGEPVKVDAATEFVDKRSTSESQVMRNAAWQYLCFPEAFKRQICKGFDPDPVAKLLRARGHLQCDGDRLTTRQRLPGTDKPVAVYLIKPSIFADEFEDV